MKSILVIVDQECEPKVALSKALDIARAYQAKVHVLACCSHEESWIGAVVGMHPVRNIKEDLITHTKKWVKEMVAELKEDVEVTHEVIWTEDFIDSVIDVARKQDSDWIVKTGRITQGLFHTPTDYKLLRESIIPVYIVVSRHQQDKSNTALIALDLQTDSEKKQALNRKMLAMACEISKRRGFDLMCCYSVDVPVVLKDLDLINVEEFIEKNAAKAKIQGEALLAEFGLPPEILVIEAGAPEKTIHKLAHKHNIRWVMLGSVSKRGLKAAIIGNRCEKVLASSKHDLLMVSPD